MNLLKNWYFLLLFPLISGCGLALSYILRPCKLDMDKHAVSVSSCELNNGVYMEELMVHSFHENGLPDSAETIVRVEGFVSGSDNYPERPVKRLRLDKPQEPYKWSMDSMKYYLKVDNNSRHRIVYRYIAGSNSIEQVEGFFGVINQDTFKACPLTFKPDTWYFVHIYDPSISAIYVYVNKQNKFEVHTIESGVSPI